MSAYEWQVAAVVWTAFAVVTGVVLLRVVAPYGRHARPGWGVRIPAVPAWMAMEAASPLVMTLLFVRGDRVDDLAARMFLALWLAHYAYRSVVFPLLGRGRKAPVPLGVFASALAFNVINAAFNGQWLFAVGPVRGSAWLLDPRFLVGTTVFATGFIIHLRADAILRGLRSVDEGGYRVPRGFLFERVSCPNYFGEVMEWTGWALLTWSCAGLSFASVCQKTTLTLWKAKSLGLNSLTLLSSYPLAQPFWYRVSIH